MDNPFQRPGEQDLLRIMGLNSKEQEAKQPDPKTKTPKGSGGLSAAGKQTLEDRKISEPAEESPLETYEYPTLETPKPEAEAKTDTAVLSDAKWPEPDTLFHQEVEVSVKIALPKGKEHITRVTAELFAQQPSGPVSISKGEGHAQSDGIAVIVLPVYKPRGHEAGIVEMFIEYTHKLAKMLSTAQVLRPVSETALKSADHILIPGTTFDKETSFIGPKGTLALKAVESRFKEWEKKFPKKAQIAVFGHTDKDEKDSKGLSERRAKSAFAFITNDAAVWDKLYIAEKWGLKALQTLLKDLGHYHGGADGEDGPNTQGAFKAFQKGVGLPESGREDSATRKAIFAKYMSGKHDIKINASRFCKVSGQTWMGCAAHNQVKESEGAVPENRRVAFILINPSKHFPVNFPCQDGSEAACRGQCEKEGKRSAAGIKCLFYDELVREEKQAAAAKEEPSPNDEPAWMPIARKELGVTEIPGEKNNPRILEYHATTVQKINNDDEDGAWCASFVNWCLIQSGHVGNNSAKAVDWVEFGREVKEPIQGAVAVVQFGPGRYHVGFVDGLKGEQVLVLGGNQSHGTKVSISSFKKSEIHCYRFPKEYAGHEIASKVKDGQYGQDDYDGTR